MGNAHAVTGCHSWPHQRGMLECDHEHNFQHFIHPPASYNYPNSKLLETVVTVERTLMFSFPAVTRVTPRDRLHHPPPPLSPLNIFFPLSSLLLFVQLVIQVVRLLRSPLSFCTRNTARFHLYTLDSSQTKQKAFKKPAEEFSPVIHQKVEEGRGSPATLHKSQPKVLYRTPTSCTNQTAFVIEEVSHLIPHGHEPIHGAGGFFLEELLSAGPVE